MHELKLVPLLSLPEGRHSGRRERAGPQRQEKVASVQVSG